MQEKKCVRCRKRWHKSIKTPNRSTMGRSIMGYEDEKQNVKHVLTTGTTLVLLDFSLHAGLEFTFIQWHRDLDTRFTVDHYIVEDNYVERKYLLFLEFVYKP